MNIHNLTVENREVMILQEKSVNEVRELGFHGENHEMTKVHENLIRIVNNNLTVGKIYDNSARGVDKDGEV